MSTICTSNLTSGFIDLATYDEQEKYMYGGPDATAYFVRDTRKSTWFTQVPVVLSRASGSAGFNQEWSVSISRAGDYLLYTWLRVTLPKVQLKSTSSNPIINSCNNNTLRWTRNVAHNLIRECCISFNDLVAARFDNYHLDFWSAFTVPAGKQNGYRNMIGDVDLLTQPYMVGQCIPEYTLNLPLPFFFTRDSGVALPTAALPYNDMRISFSFRDWTELLIVQQTNAPFVGVTGGYYCEADQVTITTPQASELENSAPELKDVQVWANYAIVSNDERKRMACAPRDILIEQVQTAPIQNYNVATNPQPQYDIRFSHAVKVLFFAARNKTFRNVWSNYTTASPVIVVNPGGVGPCSTQGVAIIPPYGVDPVEKTSLIYENTQRLFNMGSDYYSLVNPYYHSPVIPVETGYHSYSYSLDYYCLDPMGSTNYGKLTNVSLVPQASQDAQYQAGTTINGAVNGNTLYSPPSCTNTVTRQYLCGKQNTTEGLVKQTFDFIVTCVNNNIIRISGGALGFPVL
jgi:hypothetical protein